MTTTAKTKKPKVAETVLAYKGFDKDFKCRDMQYAVGQTFTHDGPVKACSSGLHACERPLDVLRYYKANVSRFAVVRASGVISRHEEDSKIAAASLTIEAEIGIPELVTKTVEWVLARCTPAEGGHATKDNESASTSKPRTSATASGYYGAATASGDYGAATASGNYGAATASGYSGAATASGNYGAATASGYSGAATASGNYGAATAKNKTACAMAPGRNGSAQAVEGAAIFLTYRDADWNIVHARAGIAGRDGLKPDTFYKLNASGEFVEAA